jgi:hypothetical protein
MRASILDRRPRLAAGALPIGMSTLPRDSLQRLKRVTCVALLLACSGGVVGAQQASSAQDTPSPSLASPSEPQQVPPPIDWQAQNRACEGCPPRRVGRALLQTTLINVLYETANLIRGQVTARITPASWWENMSNGWVWDLDDFEVNQIGHPYQGSNYFTSGRANGLSFYESAALTAFGSATWEYFGETNHPSLNDFINTTLGGIALGEMFHRAAWLVRDTRASGSGRLWSEIGATVLDPVTGLNRFRSGDASRVTDKPDAMMPSTLAGVAAAGVLWRGSETRAVESTGQPFVEADMLYGDAQTGRSRTPYDAFSVRLRFGGGHPLSEARVRGRLLGQPLGSGKTQLLVMQSYDYQRNDAYATGAQSIEAAFGFTQPLTSRTSMWFRVCPRGLATTTTVRARHSAPRRSSAAIDAHSQWCRTKAAISTRLTASAPITLCSAYERICCCRFAGRSASVSPPKPSSATAFIKTNRERSWNTGFRSFAPT